MATKAEEILKKVKRIEIATRKTVDTLLSGQYHTRFKGHGMQFSDFREYYPGDDIRHIDWKVTARTQLAHIKKFEEERDLTVYLLVDMSGSGQFGSVEKTKNEALSEVCALLAFAAVKNNDRVGLILFTDHIEKHIPPKKGQTHAMRLVAELLDFRPQHQGTDISQALEYYAETVKNTAIVFLASDFYGTGYQQSLKKVAKKHDLIAIRMRDPREVEVPMIGKIEFQDAESNEVFWINSNTYAFQNYFKKTSQAFETQLETCFNQAGAERLDLWTNEDYFSKTVLFFRKRKKR